MKVYSLYNKNKTFLGAFPSREDAVKYGQVYKSVDEDGWEYDIIEKYLHEYPTLLSTTPNTLTPYSQPITPPYTPNICRPNVPTATYDFRADSK